MKIFSQSARILPIGLVLLASIGQSMGFVLEDSKWPNGAKIVMHLGLNQPKPQFEDGFASWNASAADAVAIWNGYLDFATFSAVSSSTVPQVSGDGVNSVFFSDTIFGDSFGEDTLAVTVLLPKPSDMSTSIEADVVVNSAASFSSYRGVMHADPTYDLHRVLLHEFGHVLGLDHNSDYPLGTKIMEPIISDLDHLGSDDIAGVRSLYGAEVTIPGPVTLIQGDRYSRNLQANNNPTSYSATGLPPGITIDSMTGLISGTATSGGVYHPVITAHGPIADAYGSFQITVRGLDEVPGLLRRIPLDAVSLVADPIRPRIYTAGPAGISMINTDTFAVTSLLSGDKSSASLSISADASKLLFTEANSFPTLENKIDLETLQVLADIVVPNAVTGVYEGLDNRAYVTDGTQIHQFDATTGFLQQSFGPADARDLAIAISPDRGTLYVTQDGVDAGVSVYNISAPDPVLLRQRPGALSNLTPSPDGQFLYYVSFADGQSSLVQAHLPTLSPAKSVVSSFLFNFIEVGLDGAIYDSFFLPDALTESISVYDPHSLRLTATIDPDNLDPESMDRYSAKAGTFDSSGRYFFASVTGPVHQVWVFSTDLAALPPPPPPAPTKNLLNVSTRTLDQKGDDAMIGGFIIQGSAPKQILIRGLGPSLPITGAMSDPVLDLYDSTGKLLAHNDSWTSNRLKIIGTGIPPSSEREAAILTTLQPGAYTAVVRDVRSQPGLALVEVYDLDPKDSLLANISTRGKAGSGDDAIIGGFIVGGADPTKVLIRAIGPSLSKQGVAQPLADPVLELHDGMGNLISSNDNWRETQQSQIIATGIPPTDNRESAIVATLDPGNYTAIVRGQGDGTGIALVEIYNLDSAAAH